MSGTVDVSLVSHWNRRMLYRQSLIGLVVAPFLLLVGPGVADARQTTTSAALHNPVKSRSVHLPDARQLAALAPQADAKVLALALSAVRCAQASGAGVGARRLAVIDYSRASLERRLWVFDLAGDKLLYRDLVAHGKGSGGNFATHFSNANGSHASSLGLFVTGPTYVGHNGYSLRLKGLEPGFNDASMARDIVIHGASYVSAEFGRRAGRLGRSWGCPALRQGVTRPIIDVLKNGQFVFVYYPDQAWLTRSALLHCAAVRSGELPASAHSVPPEG